MAGPNLLKSDVERRLVLGEVKVIFKEGARVAESGNFEEVRDALVHVALAARKLAEVVESLLEGGTP